LAGKTRRGAEVEEKGRRQNLGAWGHGKKEADEGAKRVNEEKYRGRKKSLTLKHETGGTLKRAEERVDSAGCVERGQLHISQGG